MDAPFDVLQVDPDASDEEIDSAYRRRILETHPDQGGSARELQRVREAYDRVTSDERPTLDTGRYGDPRAASAAGSPRTDDADVDDGGSAGTTGRDDGDGDADGREGYRVDFLNYEVLGDHGWTLDDEDLFEKASDADLDPADYGRVFVEPRESLLEAAESCGFSWPYSCRGGACANCAVAVVDGGMEMPAGQILTTEYLERGIRLSCISAPITDETKVVFNVKHLPGLDELRLPPRRFGGVQLND